MTGRIRAIGKLRIRLPPVLTHRITTHLDAMSIVDQPVEDAIGQRRVADLFMPPRNRQLRGQDRGAHLVAVFADLPDVAALGLLQGFLIFFSFIGSLFTDVSDLCLSKFRRWYDFGYLIGEFISRRWWCEFVIGYLSFNRLSIVLSLCTQLRLPATQTTKVGIREFRENLADYLESKTPVAITRRGSTIGIYVPTKPKASQADLEALRVAGEKMQDLIAAAGTTEDQIVTDFKRARRARRTLRTKV